MKFDTIYDGLIKGTEKLALVGLGYVGMPIAVEFAKHISVIGFDINEKRVNEYASGIDATKQLAISTAFPLMFVMILILISGVLMLKNYHKYDTVDYTRIDPHFGDESHPRESRYHPGPAPGGGCLPHCGPESDSRCHRGL